MTARVLSRVYPNGQEMDLGYFGNTGDRRLQTIHNKLPGGATLSKFDYSYGASGNLATWAQQRGANSAETYTYGYDGADQLRKATLTSTAGAVLKTYGYGYDNAGNRTVEAADSAATTASYNNRNQITSQVAGGALPVTGTLSEAATVTINAVPASVGADNRFSGQALLGTGTQTLTVVATDPSGNARTNTYQVNVSGSAVGPFTYDDNGNLASDGVKTYEWDAENRLVTVKQGATTIASFSYDGNGRRRQKTAGGVTHTYLYDNAQLAEDRLSSGGAIKYVDGLAIDQHLAMQDQAGAVSYFAGDHLGSVTDVTTSSGAVSLTRKYDPWGNLLGGANASGYAFTGREWDAETGLYYYRARYYDPAHGRFISDDPIGLEGGVNSSAYVDGDPVSSTDPAGLMKKNCSKTNCTGYAAGVGCSVGPSNDESMYVFMGELGFTCTPTAGPCECKCGQDRMVLYIMISDKWPVGRSPYRDPWYGGRMSEWHTIKGAKGCGRTTWTYVPYETPKGSAASKPRTTIDPYDPDSYWKGDVPGLRYCCCRTP